MSVRHRHRAIDGWLRALAVAAIVFWGSGILGAQTRAAQEPGLESQLGLSDELLDDFRAGLSQAALRLPLAALLGALLALRPRRGSSPPRDPAVIETQIVLAIVGALIMLVVGASLARAFGIAGAANLIRYRAKIEDPKDAVVMLSTLSVGLASGVGLFGLAVASTLFIAITLWIIEGFETRVRTFLLTVRLGDGTPSRRDAIERILSKARTRFELRTTADDGLSYLVTAGDSLKTEKLSAELIALAPKGGKVEVEWKEEKKAQPLTGNNDDDE